MAKKKKGSSALKQWKKDMFWACSKGETSKVVMYLGDPRAPTSDPNAMELDKAGNRPLHCAVLYWKNSALADCLLGRGADINQVNKFGKTALHIAAHQGSGGKGVDEEAVRWLLSRGASTTTRDSTGATAADCASAMGNRRIEALLSEGRSHSDKATKAPKGGTVSAKPSTGRVSTNSLPVPSGAWGDDGAGRRGGSSAPQTSNACALL
jgi:ankyrin repeat protein